MEKSKNKCKVEQPHSSVAQRLKDSYSKSKQTVCQHHFWPSCWLPRWGNCKKAKEEYSCALIASGVPQIPTRSGWCCVQGVWAGLVCAGAEPAQELHLGTGVRRCTRTSPRFPAQSPAKPWHCCNLPDSFVLSSFKYIMKCSMRGSLAWN